LSYLPLLASRSWAPLVATPQHLAREQVHPIVAFVRDGVLDPRARPDALRHLVLERLPSGETPLRFQFATR
jgi:hypothetical protein